MSGALGLYVHVPFCAAICSYCHFTRGLLDPDLKRRYVAALTEEIARAGDGARVDSIFFGGGTPSLLDPAEVGRVLDACRAAFDVASDAEVTLEMNPESCDAPFVEAIRACGVTRVSLGVQSFDDRELARLDRTHTAGAAQAAYAAARAGGCRNVSLDLMLWLPGQARAGAAAAVEAALALAPDHLSIYLLELYAETPLGAAAAGRGWARAPADAAAAMYLEAFAQTDAAGYRQYEISNTARPGCRSRHNLKYWQDGAWLGFGCGAHSTRDGVRSRNVTETAGYVAAVEQGRSPAAVRRRLSRDERVGDALITGLRLVDGVDPDGVARRYGVDVRARYGPDLARFVDAGWLDAGGGRWRLTRAGMLLSNEVLAAFV